MFSEGLNKNYSIMAAEGALKKNPCGFVLEKQRINQLHKQILQLLYSLCEEFTVWAR